MNERIRQLAEQAGEEIQAEYEDESRRNRRLYNEIFLPKFAELIISDVLDILADSKNFNKCVYTTFDSSQGQCITIELAKKIKEHFGNKQ